MTAHTIIAKPYDLHASPIYFDTLAEFNEKQNNHFNEFGEKVEEYSLELITYTDTYDAELFEACKINQSNLNVWFDEIMPLSFDEKLALYSLVAVDEYKLDYSLETIQKKGIDDIIIYEGDLLSVCKDMFNTAHMEFFESNPYLEFYIDYDAVVNDYRHDMCEFDFYCTTYVKCY